MVIFATGCCVLMVIYWTVLLTLLYYTRNTCSSSGENESMKCFENEPSETMQNTQEDNEEEVKAEKIDNFTDHTETQTEIMECETKKEN